MKNTNTWKEIISDYKKAREYLCCPKLPTGQNWHRDEANGYYYLWKAYHFATMQSTKNHLWYARILYFMARERQYKQRDDEIVKQYLEPCIKAYELAKLSDEKPEKNEVSCAKAMYDEISYEKYSAETEKRAYSIVKALPEDLDFAYHDSTVISFFHDEDIVKLTLDYYGTQVTFLFEGVEEIKICGYCPIVSYIDRAYCYRAYHSTDWVLDLEYYIIRCRKISIEGYKKTQKTDE